MKNKIVGEAIHKLIPHPKEHKPTKESKHKINETMMDQQWKKHPGGG